MMKRISLLIIPATLLISGCSSLLLGAVGMGEKVVVTDSKYVKQSIPIQERPKPVDFPDTQWYVVNESNLDEFLKQMDKEAGDTVFFAITPKGYENLAIGVGELRRYILQQKEIILYYESAIRGDDEKKVENKPK
jgi:hypothetical protein